MNRTLSTRIGEALVLAIVAGTVLFAGWGYASSVKTSKAYTPTNLLPSEGLLPASLIRLHIIANSDEEFDQEVKLLIRDELFSEFGPLLSEAEEREDARGILSSSLHDIEKVAQSKLEELDIGYGAKASITREYFPDRSYTLYDGSTIFLPKGMYETLKVVLGKGKGQNWWCVMYPPLCYFDLVQRSPKSVGVIVPDRQSVSIIDEDATSELPIELRSLVFDTVRNGINKIRGTVAPKLLSVLEAIGITN
jgi:stage II sporulation protein R